MEIRGKEIKMIQQNVFDDFCKKILNTKWIEQVYEIKKLDHEAFKVAMYDYQCGVNDAENNYKYQGGVGIYDFYKIGYDSVKKQDET